MARPTSALAHVLVVLILAAFSTGGPSTAAENSGKEDAVAAPERIIDQLANEHPIGKARTLDKQRQARVDEATAKLIHLGAAAFPALVAHRDDKRYSYTFVGSFNEGPLDPPSVLDYTVGDACIQIIARQLNAGSMYLGCRDYTRALVPRIVRCGPSALRLSACAASCEQVRLIRTGLPARLRSTWHDRSDSLEGGH